MIRSASAGLRLALVVAAVFGAARVGAARPDPVETAAGSFPAVGDQPGVRLGGVTYISAAQFLHRYGLTAKWVEPGKSQEFKSAWTRIVIENDSREIAFNALRLFLGSAAMLRDGALWIDRIDAEKWLGPLLKPATYAAQTRPVRRIVLDAGHGGRDSGTSNRKLKLEEKNLTLDVVRRLAPLLKSAGFEVVLTRDNDTYVGLAERAERGRTERADLFVSIHFNSADSEKVSGLETYVLTPQHQRSTSSQRDDPSDDTFESGNAFDPWSAVLGYQIHRSLGDELKGFDRGLKRARFAVLRLAECPAVLVEAGYLSSPTEARKLATPAYRDQIAQAVANGVIAFSNQILALSARR